MEKTFSHSFSLIFTSFIISIFSIFPSYGRLLIISDIDDTIRVSQVKNKTAMIYNQLVGQESFPFLIEIYHQIKNYHYQKGEGSQFYYLSASPKFISVKNWLKKYLAPEGKVQQRNLFDLVFSSTENYKFMKLKEILVEEAKLATESGEPLNVFLFGDNGEKDAEVYSKVLADPDLQHLTIKAYIRKVSGGKQELPGPTYFVSEKDLLKDQSLNKFLSESFQKKVHERSLDELVPSFIQEELLLSSEELCKDPKGQMSLQ